MNKRGEYLEPVITETRIWNQANLIFAVVLAGVFIIAGALSILLLGFSTLEKVILGFGLVAVYAIILFFLIEPTLLREIRSREIQTIEKPVFRTIEKPVEVEKIVDRQVPVYINRPQYINKIKTRYINKIKTRYVDRIKTRYIQRRRKKLNIPHYEYVGSSETKTYHKRSCRLSRLIKRKYSVHNNSPAFFKHKRYHPCKVCILKQRKA